MNDNTWFTDVQHPGVSEHTVTTGYFMQQDADSPQSRYSSNHVYAGSMAYDHLGSLQPNHYQQPTYHASTPANYSHDWSRTEPPHAYYNVQSPSNYSASSSRNGEQHSRQHLTYEDHPVWYEGPSPSRRNKLPLSEHTAQLLPRPKDLQLPDKSIKFDQDGTPGVELDAEGICNGTVRMDDANEQIFARFGFRKTSVTLFWPGYESTDRAEMISVRDGKECMTRKKFTLWLANTIQQLKRRASLNDTTVKTSQLLVQQHGYRKWSLRHDICRIRRIKLTALHYYNRYWVPELIIEMHN